MKKSAGRDVRYRHEAGFGHHPPQAVKIKRTLKRVFFFDAMQNVDT